MIVIHKNSRNHFISQFTYYRAYFYAQPLSHHASVFFSLLQNPTTFFACERGVRGSLVLNLPVFVRPTRSFCLRNTE
jgi:hypothetical protein